MRKTLTAIVVVLAAGSLAACKMPWDKEKDPPPVAASTDAPAPDTTTATTTAVDPSAPTDVSKPADQTASVDVTKSPEASTKPATK